MGKCSICGGNIQSGAHHESTTICIRFLCERIDALERIVRGGSPLPPFQPPHQG